MSDLSEEVKKSFVLAKSLQEGGSKASMVITDPDVQLAPGFTAMREYYGERTMVQLRRAYRHFAGSNMPSEPDALLALTSPIFGPKLVTLLSQVFTDGVMIGQGHDLQIKMAIHFGTIDDLFEHPLFRDNSNTMAKGFDADTDVHEFLVDYVAQSAAMLSHFSGFVHVDEVDPAKIWDLWNLACAATTTSAYAAGFTLGQSWAERDTLDGIVIATTEGGTHGSAGEAGQGGTDH